VGAEGEGFDLRGDLLGEFDRGQVARAGNDSQSGVGHHFVQALRHGNGGGGVVFADDDGDGHAQGARGGAEVGVA